jgi:hypothetical protein
VQKLLRRWREAAAEDLGAAVVADCERPSVVTWWLVQTHDPDGGVNTHLLPLAVSIDGGRALQLEQAAPSSLLRVPSTHALGQFDRERLLREVIEPMLGREAAYRGLSDGRGGISTRLVGWVECIPASGHIPYSSTHLSAGTDPK